MTDEPDANVAGRTGAPDVSVIIPAHNAGPYLDRCLDSVVAQTIGLDRMEVVVVDDGSTDGTGEAADSWAARYPDVFRVVHNEVGSGGPAAPRNTALDLVTGRYVFFLDADDHLGHEALQRLVAAADENGSDVVAGQMSTSTGRGLPNRSFRRTDLDADVFTSDVYWSLSALKLFRRELLEKNQIRFPTEFPILSDQPFTALAYLRARRISVLADYDYYFAEWRDDGKHVTRSGSVSDRIDVVEAMCALVLREVVDPVGRSHLLQRHLQGGLWRTMRGIVAVPRGEQESLVARVTDLLRAYLDAGLMEALTPDRRVVYEVCRRGLLDKTLAALEGTDEQFSAEAVVDGDRAYAVLPFFRSDGFRLPDELYEMTDRVRADQSVTAFWFADGVLHLRGHAGLRRVAQVPSVAVVLRGVKESAGEHAVPATVSGDGFAGAVDLRTVADGSPLPGGSWTVHVQVGVEGLVRTPRLRAADPDGVELTPTTDVVDAGSAGTRIVRALVQPGGLLLQVGGPVRLADLLRGWTTSREGTELLVNAETEDRITAPVIVELVSEAGEVRSVLMEPSDRRRSGRLPLAGLPEGRWRARLHLGAGSPRTVVPAPAAPGPTPLRWRRSWRVMEATTRATKGQLVVQVRHVGYAEWIRRAVRTRFRR